MRGRHKPAKDVECFSIALSHVPDLPWCEFVGHCSSILAKDVFEVHGHIPADLLEICKKY